MHRECYINTTETFEHNEKIELTNSILEQNTTINQLKFYRLKAHMTQQELAKTSNISVCTIKRLENNKTAPDVKTYKKIAVALDIDVDLLYDDYLKFITSDYSSIIKAYRKTSNLTQQQLADILGTSIKTISCWERQAQYPSKQMHECINQLINR